jgi:hypothetical protein
MTVYVRDVVFYFKIIHTAHQQEFWLIIGQQQAFPPLPTPVSGRAGAA